jgi:hypothetical protein
MEEYMELNEQRERPIDVRTSHSLSPCRPSGLSSFTATSVGPSISPR